MWRTLRPMLSIALVAASLLPFAGGAGAGARARRSPGIYGGVIVVGRSVAGIKLGMTHAQVLKAAGRPLSESGPGYRRIMHYEHLPAGQIPAGVRHGIFDVYLRAGRVRMIILGAQSGFRLLDGNHLFLAGGLRRLLARYGHRVKAMRYEGEPVYRIVGRYLGKVVWTDFWTGRLGPDARIASIDILFPPA